jgi:hypothetical protein
VQPWDDRAERRCGPVLDGLRELVEQNQTEPDRQARLL